MADLARLVLDADTRGLKGAERDLDSVTRSASRSAREIGSTMRDVGTGLTVGVTAPLAAMGAAALLMSSNFEAGMSNVATLVDTTTESMDEMGQRVLEISRSTPVAISDLTDALYNVRSAGIDAADAMDVLEGSARLGVAALGTTAEAVDIVTSSINAFGLEGKEQERVYDLLFRTVQSGKTTLSELTQGFGATATAVASAGIELDDYLAAIAALTTTGLPASEAQSQLRAAMSGLTRQSELTREVFGALGVKTFPELVEKSGGMVSAFEAIQDELGGNAAKLIELVGSVEAYNAIIGLTGQNNEAYTKTLEGMRSGVSAVDDAFDKQNETMAAQAQRTTNALESMSISIGAILAPAAESLAMLLIGLTDAFSGLPTEMQTTIVVIAALVAAVGPLLLVLGTMATGFGAIVTAAPAIATAFGVIKAAALGLLANPLFLGAAAVIAGIYLAWENWDKIEGIVSHVGSAVSGWWSDTVSPVLTNVANALVEGARQWIDWHAQVAEASQSAGRTVSEWIGDRVGRAWDAARDTISNAAASILSAVDDMTGGMLSRFIELNSAVLTRMAEVGRNIIQGLVQGIRAAPGAIRDALWSTIGSGVDYVKGRLGIRSPSRLFMEMGGYMMTGLAIGISDGRQQVSSAMDDLATMTDRAGGRVVQGFNSMAQGVIGSFQSLVGSIKGGGFLDILGSVVGLFGQVAGTGALGSGLQGFFGGPRANGGPVTAGTTYLVGEEGPELFTAPGNGRIVANDNMAAPMKLEIVPSQYFDVRVNGRIMEAGPTIAQAGAGLAQSQMAENNRYAVQR